MNTHTNRIHASESRGNKDHGVTWGVPFRDRLAMLLDQFVRVTEPSLKPFTAAK